jgi:hypothetical protein
VNTSIGSSWSPARSARLATPIPRPKATPKRAPARDYLIYGVTRTNGLVGAASIWMPWERRGDFQRMWREVRELHGGPSEARWKKVKRKHLPFFLALVDEFFARDWLRFHCLLAPSVADPSARTTSARIHLGAHLAEELANIPGTHRLRVAAGSELGPDALDASPRTRALRRSVREVSADDTPALSLARLFLRAVIAAHEPDEGVKRVAQGDVLAHLADHLGVDDLVSFSPVSSTYRFTIHRAGA